MDIMSLFSADSAMGKMMAAPIAQMSVIMESIANHMRVGNQINDQLLAEIADLRRIVEINNSLLVKMMCTEVDDDGH